MITATGVIRLGTRASRLARFQTDLVRQRLAALHPAIDFRTAVITTHGDRDVRTPLPAIGGKGVFTEELETALREGAIDLAVHSLKDVPVEPAAGLTLIVLGPREDPRDVLISREGWTLERLPPRAAVGTCSTRRSAQLLAVRPDLRLLPLRGNVDTRVRDALAGDFDAIVIAAAGVHRLGLGGAVTQYLPLEVMLPAPGQGALAVQCRSDDAVLLRQLGGLGNDAVQAATDAERGFLEGLGGGCAAPIAALGEVSGDRLELEGLVASLDGRERIYCSAEGPMTQGRALGLALAARARTRGAEALLE
ncbi:MAG TPA: hydroxymethylbilane synthase [Gemmatimonadales bacterium]|nr:hydroxymethylbilane synthase [Gemmatimonadales bacterium]